MRIAAQEFGLQLVPEKCFLTPGTNGIMDVELCRVHLGARGIDVNINGRKILGSPFGPTPQSLATLTEAIVRQHDKMLDVLESPHMDPKVAHLILRMCMAPRLCYLMRTMPPPLLDDSLRAFDARLQGRSRGSRDTA